MRRPQIRQAEMVEQDLRVQAAGAELAGTLCLPDGPGPHPSVLMVHGSGPLDRNENMPGQRLDVFNAFAHRLAAAGVASFRYDKRGCGASSGDFDTAGHHDLVDDAVACFEHLRTHTTLEPSERFVLGHSEGCLIAAEMENRQPTAGLILLNPFVERLESILMRQAGQLERESAAATGFGGVIQRLSIRWLGGPVRRQGDLIAAVKRTTGPVIRIGGQTVQARWLREWLALDPEVVFHSVACPMLLVGGDKDLQCEAADIDRIAALAPGRVDTLIIADLTHVLRREEGSPSLLGVGRLLSAPVEPTVLEGVAEWVSRQATGRAESKAVWH